MTAHAHARRRVLGRLLDLARGHGPVPAPPDLISMRVAGYGDGPKIVGFWNEWTDGPGLAYDTSYDHPGWDDEQADPHPPWQTAPQPALSGPGRLGAFYAAADLRDQRAGLAAEYESFYGWGAPLDASEGRVRPYAPEPVPEPVPVSYPPLDLRDDLAECVIFRDTVRCHFVRQEHARGRRAQPGETWLQEQARVYGERFTAELDDIARRAAGAPVPDYRITEQWAGAAPGGMLP